MLAWLRNAVAYVKARALETSTYEGLTAAVIGGAALPYPWSVVAVALGAVKVFLPTHGFAK